jgi:hypothetical protein
MKLGVELYQSGFSDLPAEACDNPPDVRSNAFRRHLYLVEDTRDEERFGSSCQRPEVRFNPFDSSCIGCVAA